MALTYYSHKIVGLVGSCCATVRSIFEWEPQFPPHSPFSPEREFSTIFDAVTLTKKPTYYSRRGKIEFAHNPRDYREYARLIDHRGVSGFSPLFGNAHH